MVIRVPDDELAPLPPVTIAVQAGRFRYPPEGLFGGGDGSKARFLKNEEPADSSGLTFAVPGDRMAFYSAGGGGYGDPFDRDPHDVAEDVLNGYVSIEKACEDYGVIIAPDTLAVDEAATAACREKR